MTRDRNPRFHWAWWLLAITLLVAWQYWPQATSPGVTQPVEHGPAGNPDDQRAPKQAHVPAPPVTRPLPDAGLPSFLPVEAMQTVALIQRNGPFPHRQDGSVFGNREGHLPRKPRGWYREYTVDTPGVSHRGARRIVTGGNPPQTWYYSSDHYDSFRAFAPGMTSGALR